MRRSSYACILVLLPCVLLPFGCVQPQYPDDFEETASPSLAADASLPVAPVMEGEVAEAVEAGPPPQDKAGELPPAQPEAGPPASAGGGGSQDGGRADAGSVAIPPTRDAGAQAALDASTTTDARTMEVEDAAVTPPVEDVPTSCTITASTDASNAFPYAGKYGCAVWIGDSSKKVVKAFLVATRIASRSGLSTYRTASSGVTVDVVAGATLSAARQHMYTWDLKTAAGGKATAGGYTLNVETHSSNGDKTVSVPFELGKGTVTAMGTPTGDVRAASIRCQ